MSCLYYSIKFCFCQAFTVNFLKLIDGIEPTLSVYKTDALPLSYISIGDSGWIRTNGPFRNASFQDWCNKPDSATLPLNKFSFNILVLVMGLEPILRIRKHGLSVLCLPISPHQHMGVYGLWASVVRYTPNLKTDSNRHDLTPFYFEHLGGNRTLNDFQVLQRSAFLCDIILFVYSDTT